MRALADRIDALLPQTQCTRCGYPSCRAYAQAVASGAADFNRCAPGGSAGVAALAALLGQAPKPIDPACGAEAPPTVALIDEDTCIGCTKCIQACPVDAIVGAAKRMHAVLVEECTGCGLCLPPCPVDCIALVPTAAQPLTRAAVLERADHARERFEAREQRLGRDLPGAGSAQEDTAQVAANAHAADGAAEPAGTQATPAPAAPPITRSAVLEAIARGRARKAAGWHRGQ